MKSKSPAQAQQQAHSSSFETPKKKISSSVDGCKRALDDGLQTPKINRSSSTKKSQRKRRRSESDEEKIDRKTEENIQQVAFKNNLTEDAVKKILKKVVGNDHVLAICKLKEEEMEKSGHANKLTDEEEDEDDYEDVEHAPKITRSKAKVLNKIILPITSPSEPSEASILLQEELRSDDEDEEYEPGNEDGHSDDDHNSSVSDMDSQPRTPRTPYTAEEDSPTKYTNDGLFKIPRDLNDSSTSSLYDQDCIVAKRTRSKVSLTTTALETIESTFQPPDVLPDMYDRDNELDTDWLEFLNVLTKPINQTVEDDDETDPEYIAAADQIPIDKEELREVNISKKELNDLVDELFSNLSDVDFDEINKYDIIPEIFRNKQKSNRSDSNPDLNKSDIPSDQDSSFRPSEISTPVSTKQKATRNSTAISGNDSTMSMVSNLTANQTSTLMDSHSQTATLITLVNPFQGATLVNGVIQMPQFQQILMQIPTTDLLKMRAQQQCESVTSTAGCPSHSQSMEVSQYQPIVLQIPTIDILKIQAQTPNQQQQQQQLQSQTITSTDGQSETLTSRYDRSSFMDDDRMLTPSAMYQSKLFQHLKTDLPVTVEFDAGLQGFTDHQREILNQQLRMHVQFAAQNFLQVYGNPGNSLWKQAPKYKSFLTELDDVTRNSTINIGNLQPALNVIDKWESDLMQPDSDANQEYAEFLLGESTKSQNAINGKVRYIPQFSKRMMDAVIESVAFPYPHLLPRIPFRMDFRGKSLLSDFIAMEDFLVAFHLEKFHSEYEEERIRNKSESNSKVSLERICNRICSRMCSFRLSDSKSSVYRYVCRRKGKSELYNPIKYYFQHNKAPPFHHKLIEIDCNNLRAPKDCPLDQLHQIPFEWAARIKQLQAIKHSKNLAIRNCNSRTVQESNSLVTSPPANKSPPKPTFVVRPRTNPTNLFGPIQYEIVDVNAGADLDLTGNINATVDTADGGDVERISVNEVNERKILRETITKNRNGIRFTQTEKLSQIVTALQRDYHNLNVNISKNLLNVYSSVWNFSIYMSFVDFNVKMASTTTKRPGKDKGVDELNRKSKLVDDVVVVVEPNDSNVPSSTTTVNVSTTKKNPKAQRMDNTRLMLIPETKEDINEKDLVYAQNFMDKVEDVYSAENKSEKVTEFLHILKTFNPSTDQVEDLYYKVEQLFLPDHPELVELFLTFLLPGHAAQIGKFMEHFMLTNMNNFINKLNIYFNKQPAQIRKIMTCLRDLSNEADLKLEQIKLKVFPLLKGNPLLIEWFKQCFPNETSSDNPTDDYESLSFFKAENANQTDDENDVYENVNQSEIVSDPVDNPCHIRYLNGRVYYGSRILLPAKLSFLVVTASDQNAINEVARGEPSHFVKNKDGCVDGNETDYRCVHSIKQHGDNKMKECQKNQSETPDNSTCEDVDAEKSADEQNCSDVTDDTEPQLSEPCAPQLSEPCAPQSDEKNLSSSVESLVETVYNTCDDLTLKAHGIRLNPTVHQSNVIKSEDLLCLLDPIDDVGEKVSEESLKNSPKRQTARAQRKSSPNAKKSTKRSPINSRKSHPATTVSAEDSNAIRTAKRLKRLIESDDADEHERSTKKPKITKCAKVATDASRNRKSKQSSSDELPTIAKTEPSASTSETASTTTETATAPPVNPSNTWSRDEDKLVLEQIKMGFTNEENLVQTLHTEKLPNRSYSEIYDRFKFLMDIIANL